MERVLIHKDEFSIAMAAIGFPSITPLLSDALNMLEVELTKEQIEQIAYANICVEV